jgi:hypothetical protein
LVEPNISQDKIDLMLKKTGLAKRSLKQMGVDSKVRLLMVLVTQFDAAAEKNLRSTLVKKFQATPVDVDIHWLDFEGLQKTYAID